MSAPRVGICGLGLIGGSALLGLRAAGLDVRGCDADGAARVWCAELGVPVDEAVGATAQQVDVLVVCVPPRNTGGTVLDGLSANPEVVVVDAASVKATVVHEVRERAPEALPRLLPAHPLAGAEAHGHAAARADLLRGATWAVCPTPTADDAGGRGGPRVSADASTDALVRAAPVLDALDARLLACTPEEHDRALAATSHAPHVIAGAVAEVAADRPTGGPAAAVLSGGALRDATRVAAAPADLWAEILRLNAAPTAEALDAVADRLRAAATALRAGEDGPVRAAWERGGSAQRRIFAARWAAPTWVPVELADDWNDLLALGRAGTVVRGVRRAGDGRLTADAWATAG